MEHNNQNNNLGDKILHKIREEKIKMRSKSYFVARAALFAFGIIILLLFLIYLISFIIFSLRVSGVWFLPALGFLGIRMVFGSLPWLLIFLAAALIILLEVFAEHVSFIYKKPAVYSLLVIIAVVLVAGLVLGFSSFHTRLFANAREGRLPFVGSFYNGYGSPRFHNFHNGNILEITNDGFSMITPNGEMLTVVASDTIKKDFQAGDFVLVVGERKADVIQVSLLKKIHEDEDFFPHHTRTTKHPLPVLK